MFLQRLKQATAPHHAALEKQLPLLSPDLSLSTYRHCVAQFLGYYGPLEQALLAQPWWQQLGFAYSERRKAPQLEHDLQALGAGAQAVPQCRKLPMVETLPQLLGCLYVIEGATLGGQIITRHLHTTLALAPGAGASFFSGYGARTGSRWKDFCARMSSLVDGGCDEAQVIASANDTFFTLEQWLRAPVPAAACGGR